MRYLLIGVAAKMIEFIVVGTRKGVTFCYDLMSETHDMLIDQHQFLLHL